MTNTALDKQAPAPVATEQVAVNGVRLFSRSVGYGPPDVITVHGGPSAGYLSLVPALDELARGRRLFYYDQRGCGNSKVSPETPLGWRNHVEDLSALLDHIQIDHATIIGHSWGALLCLLFAIHNPGRVGKILLVCPAPVNSEHRARYLGELNRRTVALGIMHKQRELLRSGLRERDPAGFRRRAFQLTIAPFIKDPHATVGMEPFQISHRARQAVWRSLGDYDLSDEISTLSVTALVIHGSYDPIPLASSERIAECVGARLEVFDNSGHMPFFEQHELFLRVSEEFL